MKPIVTNKFSANVYGVKLYVDDIELILSKLIAMNDNYIITDDENIYDNLEEVKTYKGDNPKIIKIDSKNDLEFLFIRIGENWGSVSSYGDRYTKTAYEIEKIFLKRKRNPIVLYFFNAKNARNNIIVLSLLIAAIALYKRFYLKEIIDIKQSVFYLSIWFIIFFITLLNPNFNGKIELKRKHENNFFKNNKDSILVAIVISVITAVLAYLATLI